jgi:hypothetical protein
MVKIQLDTGLAAYFHETTAGGIWPRLHERGIYSKS